MSWLRRLLPPDRSEDQQAKVQIVTEAAAIQQEVITELRKSSYADLQRFFDKEWQEVTGSSGRHYYVEILSFWDEKPRGNLRVLVWIFPAGSRSPKIPISSFIVAPDGHFVGE